jgi:hypothetical protein
LIKYKLDNANSGTTISIYFIIYKYLYEQQNENIGILIECKATKVLWKKKKEYDLMPSPSFSVEKLNQGHTDYCYFFISHDELYTQLEKVGASIFAFFKTGKFSNDDSKEACSTDPFISYRK